MIFPPHLLDKLARVFAHVALDRLLKDAKAVPPEKQKDDEKQPPITPAGEIKGSDAGDGL